MALAYSIIHVLFAVAINQISEEQNNVCSLFLNQSSTNEEPWFAESKTFPVATQELHKPPIQWWSWEDDSKEFSCLRRKQTICTCENKGTDQLHRNCKADQRICIRYTDSTIPILPKSNKNSAEVDIAPASGKVNRP